MAKTTEIDLSALVPESENAREHDETNRDAIRRSLERFGAGRSVVIDSNDVVRAGNGTIAEAQAVGFDRVLVVEPEPGQLVAVRRADWSEQEAKAYGIADNRAAELAKWNLPTLKSVISSTPDIDPADMGLDSGTLEALFSEFDVAGAGMPDLQSDDPGQTQMTFILTAEQAGLVAGALSAAAENGNCQPGKKGEALAVICEAYLEG